MLARLLIASTLPILSPAMANDSIAELGTGGLVLSRSDVVAMESEDLFLSMDAVRVDYRFRNLSDRDVDAIVAFPMPELSGSPYQIPSLPEGTGDNFLDFEVVVNGGAVKPSLENRAFALGLDVSDDLRRADVSFFPFGDAAYAGLAALPERIADDWITRGLIIIDTYDDGSGWKDVRTPFWTLRSTYWWRTRFPAGQSIPISHAYRPSVGLSVGLGFTSDPAAAREYEQRFCIDKAFRKAVSDAEKVSPDGQPPFNEARLRYILKTGGNWAGGTIGRFRLVVDKGDPRNLVSFCGQNVRKTGPTTFEMTAEDFNPERDIEILILRPYGLDRDVALQPERRRRDAITPGRSRP